MESLKGVQYDKQVQFRKEALWQKLCITTVYYWHVDGNYGYGFCDLPLLKIYLKYFMYFHEERCTTSPSFVVSIFMRDCDASYGG